MPDTPSLTLILSFFNASYSQNQLLCPHTNTCSKKHAIHQISPETVGDKTDDVLPVMWVNDQEPAVKSSDHDQVIDHHWPSSDLTVVRGLFPF